jgi:hypothetical protein
MKGCFGRAHSDKPLTGGRKLIGRTPSDKPLTGGRKLIGRALRALIGRSPRCHHQTPPRLVSPSTHPAHT